MDQWLKKVEEMKRVRSATTGDKTASAEASPSSPAPVSPVPTSPAISLTPATKSAIVEQPKKNPFLAKKTSIPPSSPNGIAASSSTTEAPKSNPFLNKANVTSPPSSPTPKTETPSSGLGDGIYKIKYEQEAKRRIELEALYEAKIKEIQQLKDELGRAKTGTSSPVIKKGLSAAERKTRRMTKHQANVVNSLDEVMRQIGGLDKRIRGAEAARMQAEDKLMEIAIAKLEVDEVIHKVDTVLKKIIDQSDKFSNSQLKDMLIKVRAQTAPEEEGGGSRASMRFSIIIPQGGLQFEDAPAPPPLTTVGSLSSIKSSAEPRGGLLEQIRKGATLRNIDITKLRQEQAEFRVKAKETIGNMKSLEDVLKGALSARMTDMNLYNDDDEDEEDW